MKIFSYSITAKKIKQLTLLMGFALSIISKVAAQSNTININVTVNPPYSTNFEDYVGLGGNNVIITLMCNPSATGLQSFYLAGILKQTNGAFAPFTIVSPISPQPPFSSVITMVPGEMLSLSGSDLQPYFDESRIEYQNISQQQISTFYANKFIPDGDYQLCLTAHDYDTKNQISPVGSGCSNVFQLRNLDPPLINYPNCTNTTDAGHIQAGPLQNILFQWVPSSGLPISASLVYTFQMMEVPVGMNPNQVFQNTTYIPFEVNTGNTSSFNYNMSHPPLEIGKRYAIRVRAEDYSNQYGINNNGYSQVCSFIYGSPEEIQNFENATLIPQVNLTTGAQLFYFEEFLESTNNILRVQQAINSNSSNVTHPNEFTISAKIKSTNGNFEISTKQETSIENILLFNTSNMQDVLYPGNKVSKAFGDFESGRFNFSGNEQLLKNYLVDGTNKLILPPGNYTIEIQLMQANGITPLSQLKTYDFAVNYPYYIHNMGIPPQLPVEPATAITASAAPAIDLRSVAAAYSNRQLFTRFAIEIHSLNSLNQTTQLKFKLNTPATNCAFITNENTASSIMSFEKLLCILKQLNASDYQMQSSGTSSWINLSGTYVGANNKLKLPQGNYRLYFKTILRDSEIPLTDHTVFTTFNTTGEAATTYPLELTTLINNPVHGMDYFVKGQLLQPGSTSYVRAQISQVNTTTSIPFKVRYKIVRIAQEASPGFEINVKNEFIQNNGIIYNSSSSVQTISNDQLNIAFGNYDLANWNISNAGSNVIITDLFPYNRLRLPPGLYKLYGWAVNPSGLVNLSSPDKFVEFSLDKALDYEIFNERTSILTGKLSDLYAIGTPPSLKIIKTRDKSTIAGRTVIEIKGLSGPLTGKKLSIKEDLDNIQQVIVVLDPSIFHTYTNLSTVVGNGYAASYLLDGQEVPNEYTRFDENTDFLRWIKLPPGRYEICYQTFTPKLSFKLGPDDGYRRFFDVEAVDLNASAEFNCSGTTPPDFRLRAVYPASNDTLPFRMFPFVVQFCPFSDKFRGIQNGSFTAKKLDGSNATTRTGIDNNWPNGPQIAQFNAINGYISGGNYKVNPQRPITEQMATFLPVYENHNGILEFPETIFKRGQSYKWESTIPLRYLSVSGEVVTSQTVVDNAFGFGMPKPILNEPAHNSTIEPGDIKFKFKKGKVPTSLLPPHDILQTQRIEGTGGHKVLTYDGMVKEAYLVQVSKTSDFSSIYFEPENPTQISTSYRELISQNTPSTEVLDELYGNVEVEKNINDPGDYYWRVVWLNKPDDKTQGFYNESPVYKFTIGTPEQLAENNLNCGVEISDNNPHGWNPSELVNKNVCIGKFTLQIKEIQQLSTATNTYTGFGIIRWMDQGFKVVFSDLKINRQRQVVGGTARGEKQIPSSVAQWIRTNMSDLENAFLGAPGANNESASPTLNLVSTASTGIVNQIVSISNAVSGQATMPFGLNFSMTDLEGTNRNFIFALMDLEFTKENAKMSALMDMDFPDPTLSTLLELAATGVTIKPDGFEGDFTFFLPRDKTIPLSISPDFKFEFKGCTYTNGTNTQSPEFTNNGTYFKYKKASSTTSAYWEAGLGVKLKIKAGDSYLLKELTPNDSYVGFSGQTILSGGGGMSLGFILNLSGEEKFGFTDVPGLELECNSLVVDLSPGTNYSDLTHTKLNELKGLTGSEAYTSGNSSLFEGIYLKAIKGKYKEVFGDIELGMKDMLIDFGDVGFYGNLFANLGTAKIAGWKIKDNEIGVKFKNSFKEAYIKGKMELPISAGDPLAYRCDIKKTEGNWGLNFSVSTGEQLNADVLLAKLNLNNSGIVVSIPFNEEPASVLVTLNGKLQINPPSGSDFNLSAPNLISFQNFKLSSKPTDDATTEIIDGFLYTNNNVSAGSSARLANPSESTADGSTSEGRSECFSSTNTPSTEETINLSGFGATLSNFGLKIGDPEVSGGTTKVKLGLKFNLDLRLGPTPTEGNDESHFSITAGGQIFLYGGKLTYNPSPDGGFGFDFLPVDQMIGLGDCFSVSGQIGPLKIKKGSGLEIFNDNVKGNGFDLRVGLELDLGGGSSPEIDAQVVVGSKGNTNNKYKYFGVGLMVSGFTMPLIPPVNLTGLGGGLAVNMSRTSGNFESDPLICDGPGVSLLGNLTPNKGNFFFFLKGTGNVTSDEVAKLCLKIQAEIGNGRLKSFAIKGQARFLAGGDSPKGLFEGDFLIAYTDDGQKRTFKFEAGVTTLTPLPDATARFYINVEKPYNGDANWYIALGKPRYGQNENGVYDERCSLNGSFNAAGMASLNYGLKFYFIAGNDLAPTGAFDAREMPDKLKNAIAASGGDNETRLTEAKNIFNSYSQLMSNIKDGASNPIPGIALGAELDLSLDVNFFIIYFNFSLVAGFDMALVKLGTSTMCEGQNGPTPGVNGWYANGRFYAGMEGDLGLQIKVWFYKGRISLINAKMATILNGGGPNPWHANGGVWAYGSVLGGLIEVDMEFQFSVGKPCPNNPFSLDDLKVISDIKPENGASNVEIDAIPSASFNLQVSEVSEPIPYSLGITSDLGSSLTRINVYEVKYMEGNSMRTRNFCFPLTRFELRSRIKNTNEQFKPASETFYSGSGGRPQVSPDGKSAITNLGSGYLLGNNEYDVTIEVEIIEQIDGRWQAPIPSPDDGPRKRRIETYRSSVVQAIPTALTTVNWDEHRFSTGEPPSYLREQDVLHTMPVMDQRNFLQNDIVSRIGSSNFKEWTIELKQVPNYLGSQSPPSWMVKAKENNDRLSFKKEFFAKFISDDGSITDEVRFGPKVIPSDRIQRIIWSSSIPNLNNEKVYRLEIVSKWVGENDETNAYIENLRNSNQFKEKTVSNPIFLTNQSATAKINENKLTETLTRTRFEDLVFAIHFRTSKFNTFDEKIIAANLQGTWVGDNIRYTTGTPSQVPEKFDIIELYGYKVINTNSDFFPPLYNLSLNPLNNLATRPSEIILRPGINQNNPNSPTGSNNIASGGMLTLNKLYKNGFHRINSYIKEVDQSQGLQFVEPLLYHNKNNPNDFNNIPKPSVRLAPGPGATFNGENNALVHFPAGAISITSQSLDGKLSESEKFRGYLSRYNKNGAIATNKIVFSNPFISSSSPSTVQNEHLVVRVDIQTIVKQDLNLYKEILKKSAVEMNRLMISRSGLSNQTHTLVHHRKLTSSLKDMLVNKPLTTNMGTTLNLEQSRANLMSRLYFQNQTSFNTPEWGGSFGQQINNLTNTFFQYERNMPNSHPQFVSSGIIMSSGLSIENSFLRMYHSLQIYSAIFDRDVPNINNFDAYFNSLGIDANNIYKDLTNLTLTINESYSYMGSNSGGNKRNIILSIPNRINSTNTNINVSKNTNVTLPNFNNIKKL